MSKSKPNEPVSMAWVNGRLSPATEAVVPAGDFGFLYGEGLFETMRARGQRIAYLDRHLARLQRSAPLIGLPPPPDGELRRGISELLAVVGEGERRVRLTVTRGAAGPYDRPAEVTPTVAVTSIPLYPVPDEWRACWSPYRRDEKNPLNAVKSTDYLVNVLARRHARERGVDEALFLNTRGKLAEGSATNLFLRHGNRLSTPPLEAGALPGVMRSVLMDRVIETGWTAEERQLSPDDLLTADEAFLTNAVMGIVALTQVEEERIGRGTGPNGLESLRRLIWRDEDFRLP